MQATTTARLGGYVPAVALRMLADGRESETLPGTVVFADISGFTRLTERLSRTGDEGAEQLVDIIDGCFGPLLDDAYAAGGSLLKFGGDALLVWFEGPGHAARACDAALAMRATLRRIGMIKAGATTVVLRMSVGVHSGDYHFFLVGDSHREFLISGPAASEVVAMESAASAGQVLVSHHTAAMLPRRCLGADLALGRLLVRAPAHPRTERPAAPAVSDELIASCFSAPLRAHVIGHDRPPEHRLATVSFVQFGEIDALIEGSGPDAATGPLRDLMFLIQTAANRCEVCVLGSDIGHDGGKVLLSAGAPRGTGDEEERMLLTLREIVDGVGALPVSAGAASGHVFAAEVGPSYRRAYALMGDTTNVAARLTAKAPFGHVYGTRDLPARVRTSFRLTPLTPLELKGKRRPLASWDIGPVTGATPLPTGRRKPPLIGRERELAAIRAALVEARQGSGALVELVGETGSGKSRLLAEARRLAGGMRFVHTTCQVYTRDTPYSGAGDALRQLLGLRTDAEEETVLARLRAELTARRPDLLPWLPLLAIAFGLDVALTPEIEQLADDVRERKLQQTVFAFFEPELRLPTLFEIEHAHLIDAASAGLLAALGRELYATSWVLLITRRDAPGAFGLDDPHPRIELEPLSSADTMRLARATPEAERIPPHVLELAVARSAGSPEFLLDLLAAAAAGQRDSLPDSMSAAASARLDQLAAQDRQLICRVSLLGLSFDPVRIADVLDDDMPAPDEEQWQRLSAVFAHDSGGHVRFKRPALQEAAYARLPYKLRRQLHRRVAEALERTQSDSDPAVLSQHWLHAGDHKRAYRYSMLGAARARERFSHADAVRLYRRAIQAGRTAGLAAQDDGQRELAGAWEELGDALRCVGEPDAASSAFSAARRLLAGDPLAQARLCQRHAEVAQRVGSLRTAARWLHRGIRTIEGLPGREVALTRARLHAYLGGLRTRQGRWAEAERACRSAIAEAESIGELRSLAFACYMLDWALVELGRVDEAVHSHRALSIFRDLGDAEHESTVLNNLGMFAYFDGLWDDAVRLYQESRHCSERAGKPGDAAYTDCNVGEILSDQGHYARAAEHLESARRVWSATGERQGVAFVNLLRGRLALRRGDLGAALPALEQARAELSTLGVEAYAHFAHLLVAEAEAYAGDPRRALSIVASERAAADRYLPLAQRVAAVAHARLGQRREALSELGRSLNSARERNSDYDVAAAIDLLDRLGGASAAQLLQREGILARLHIIELPAPQLPASTAATLTAV